MIEWLEIEKQVEAENRYRNLEKKVKKLKEYYRNLKIWKAYGRR
jgi:hypothetical protein